VVVNQAMYAIVSATAWHEPRVSAKAANKKVANKKAANKKASDFQGCGHAGYAELMASCFTHVIAIPMIEALWPRRRYDSTKAAR
jgi:hypothetical protein